MDDIVLTQLQADIERVGITQRLPNADVELLESIMGDLVLRMESKVLAGVPQEVRVYANTVTSVWAAICVFWLLPVVEWLEGRYGWLWLHRPRRWLRGRWTRIERGEVLNTRMCPHIAVPEQDKHLRWVSYEHVLPSKEDQ